MASTGANIYAQLTTIGIQLLSLPFFLSKWGLETYGQWLVLSAIPAYFAMADVGMVTAAGNRMTMLVGRDDMVGANRVFQSAIAFMMVMCLGVGSVSIAVLLLLPQHFLPAGDDARLALASLIIGVLAGLFSGLPEAIYRASHRYAFGTFMSNTARLFEWAGGLLGLWLGGTFLSVAAGMLVPRLIATLLMVVHTWRSARTFRWDFRGATRAEIKSTAGPALAFMAFPVGNAIAFQGVTLVVAASLGPAAVAIFSTYRTMARVTVQATGTFGNSLWPEFSRLFGQGDFARLAALYRRGYLMGVIASVLAGGIVYAVAPYVLNAWSKGRISFVPHLMLAAMAYATVAGCWHVCRVVLLSTNRHSHLAWQYLLVSAATLPAAYSLSKSHGLVGVMLAMLVAELVMLVTCTFASHRLLTATPMMARESTS